MKKQHAQQSDAKILYATNNAYDSVLLVKGGRVRSQWDVDPEVARSYLMDRDKAGDWDDQGLDEPLDAYGAILSEEESSERASVRRGR